ncbi:MAG: aminoglycoside phosphotransferase family protein [Lachnospiraceae bacterium]|nr:aminoglycoside phosphotransferase family protein [Lachnospiraceae bacterium]
MEEKFTELANIFGLSGTIKDISVISNGNINTTYDVLMDEDGTERRFVFQKLNIFVFKNPKRIMNNIEQITSHIAAKLEAEGKSRDCVMHFAHTVDGKNYYMEEQGFWRISEYVPNTVTYNACDDLNKLRSAGQAFGNFQTMLSDFDATKLYETIPNFHNTRSRIAVFLRHVNEDPCGRVDEVQEEIAKIKSFKNLAVRLNELIDSQELPLRVTHNDTKINNVLFDKDTGEAKTVIDLDTVMPGLVAHDFGDAIRFAANTAAEDEPDLSKVSLDMNRFRAFAEGFIPEVASALTPIEIKTLALGAFCMTAELAVRFLDDYITGDQYFKTLYRGHNLIRTRCQLKLAEDMYEHLGEMNKIVSEISKVPF